MGKPSVEPQDLIQAPLVPCSGDCQPQHFLEDMGQSNHNVRPPGEELMQEDISLSEVIYVYVQEQ